MLVRMVRLPLRAIEEAAGTLHDKPEVPMKSPRAALPLIVLTLAAFSLSCDSASQSVAGLEDSDLLAKPARCEDDPSGPGCGGEEVATGSELTFAGAMTTVDPQGVTVGRDNKKSFHISDQITVDVHFTTTVGTAADVGANCVFGAEDGSVVPPDKQQALIDALRASGSLRRSLILHVEKEDMTGSIRLTVAEDGTDADQQLWTRLGHATVTDTNGNLGQRPDDRTAPVVLEYAGGDVRAVIPSTPSTGDPLVDVVCENHDVVTATIAEAAP